MKIKRYSGNPILKPNPCHDWESLNVFNAAIVHHNALFHMLYRAQGSNYISRLGYAVSSNGFDWLRLDKPVFSPENEYEVRGVEDPRLTRIEDTFYIVYAGYSDNGTRVCLASTENFITWKRYGVILPDQDDKDAALFPEKNGDRYCMIHRIPDDIWIAYSDDLVHWTDHQIIMRPRKGNWDSTRIGAAGPPLKTEHGWLFIYHGYNEKRSYRLGVALLDSKDPSKIIAWPKEPILEPEETWEMHGDVPNVVFSCGAVEVDNTYYVYYGGADRVIAVATIPKADLLRFLTHT
ncbi:MAG: glycosidase [Gemmatimonadota bacterium]|nr:MAG: glycosidase [Gemmatimonadota bacterium]